MFTVQSSMYSTTSTNMQSLVFVIATVYVMYIPRRVK